MSLWLSGYSISTKMSIRWMWRCHIIPFCAWGNEFWFNFPTHNAQISPRSVTSSKAHSERRQWQRWWQLIPALGASACFSFYFSSIPSVSTFFGIVFVSLCKWGIKILLCYSVAVYPARKLLSFGNNWRWCFSGCFQIRRPRIAFRCGAEHSSRVIRAVREKWFQISLSPTPGLQHWC